MPRKTRPFGRSVHRRPLSLERLEIRQCLTIDLQSIGNINSLNLWADIRQATAVDDLVYFVAREKSATTSDLWRTDGTTAGTINLVSLGTHTGATSPLVSAGGKLYFQATSAAHGRELWRSDGTVSGTRMVRDLTPGPSNSILSDFAVHANQLFFSANGQLTRTDGSAGGTTSIVDLMPDANDGVERLTSVGGTLYFTAQGHASGIELFQSDGTATGTIPVAGAPVGSIDDLINVGGALFFSNNNHSIWKLEPATGDAQVLAGPETGSAPSYPSDFTDVDGRLFFASQGELWKSDGTTAGTVPIKRVGDALFNLTSVQGVLYFAGGTRLFDAGYELWKSDGSVAGTFMVKDINPDFHEGYGYGSYPENFVEFNGQVVFQANSGVWTTDGSDSGTQPLESGAVTTLAVQRSSNQPNVLFFARLSTSTFDPGLWKRDGTADSTVEIRRTGVGNGDANPSAAVEFNGDVYFGANDGKLGHELWKFDDKKRPTLVKDIFTGPSSSHVANLTNFNGSLYFTAIDPVLGNGLFKSDGTASGTEFLAPVLQAYAPFVAVGENLFFTAFQGASGVELWKTDGTAAGTKMVVDIFPGSTYEYGSGFSLNSSSPSSLTHFNGQLYFTAQAEDERELWKSDGTAAGTVMAVDIFPGNYYGYPYGSNNSNPSAIVSFNGQLYFTATSETGRSLMRSDGTPTGTLPASPSFRSMGDPVVLNSQIFFLASDGISGEELWRSHANGAATLVKDINVGGLSSQIQNMTPAGGRLYFTADDGTHGRELWQTNGTSGGTQIVRDIRSGLNPLNNAPLSSNPQSFRELNGVLFFTADDGKTGRELWRTNGAAGGATQVKDLLAGPVGSNPTNLTVVGRELLFSAGSAIGRELWRASSKQPIITLPIAPDNFIENGLPIWLADEATLVDPDTPVLFGGKLTASFASPYRTGDELMVMPRGLISVTQNLVRYGGTVIGTLSLVDANRSLSIVFNRNATLHSVEQLLRSIAFRSTSENPLSLQRTVRFELSDGEAALAPQRIARFSVTPVNDAPVIGGLEPGLTYVRNAEPIRFAQAATVADVDNRRLPDGQLTVSVAGGEVGKNRIMFSSPFITVDTSLNLLRRDVIIGSVNANGGIGIPLRITFNDRATPAFVQEILQSLTFSTSASGLTAKRTITIELRDGLGGNASIAQTIELLDP